MLERYFKSVTKEDGQEYSVEVHRLGEDFTAEVFGKFGDLPEIKRSFTASGLNAEQKVQEWLFALDNEVRAIIEPKKQEEVADAEIVTQEAPVVSLS
jgi:hypothetical protein